MELKIHYIDGNCPVQAQGVIDGLPFYFRARGESWSFRVADTFKGNPVEGKLFYYEEDYGDEPFAAGWMQNSEAMFFIQKAAKIYESKHIDHKINGKKKMTKTVEVWCCGVAADHELGNTNVEVYASEEDCYDSCICSSVDPDNCSPRKITATFETDWIPKEK